MDRAVLTIATGKNLYLRMAVALARSFRIWHQDSDIGFVLATDLPDLVPPDLDWIHVHVLKPGQYGVGFSTKLNIDRMSPAEKTLYIDSDCLCTGSLEDVFKRLEGKAVSAIGRDAGDGEWFGDIERRCEMFDVEAIPVFVGALYYFEKGPMSEAVFETARKLEPRYDEIGMVRLRNKPNEEPLISLAMAIHGQHPVRDDGTIKADAMHFPDGIDVNVFSGDAVFSNTSGLAMMTSPMLEHAYPVIAHFNDSFAERLPYVREVKRLELAIGRGWHSYTADAYAAVTQTLPRKSEAMFKDMLRPVYRRIFGFRRVKENPRL